ncbi:CcmB protein [Leptospira ryugenii]|uniref:CcmB protein n=2 Tax=Leptospira ryugenii TaxID=1917863 RepID=A0A2P2DWH8_9LEPT|nr:CcmB protein [Leptospira ryugenii]
MGGFFSQISLSLCLLFIFYSSIEVNESLQERSVRGIKWAILVILNFVLIGQSLWEEREEGGWYASLGRKPLAILYFAKCLVIWLSTVIINGMVSLLLCLFFQKANVDRFLSEWMFANLGSLSLVFLGVTLGLLSEASRMKEIILPLLQLPFSIPLFLFGMEAETRFYQEVEFYLPSVGILLFFAIFYGSLGVLFLEVLQKDS